MYNKPKEHGWSLSKARTFNECPRRYYFQYYYSKNGYEPDPQHDAVLALEMSTIQTMDMWLGECVHKTIEWILNHSKTEGIPAVKTAQSYLLNEMSRGWLGSRKRQWKNEKKGVYPNLFEHYYHLRVGKASTDRLKEKGLQCIENFISSGLFRQITLAPTTKWLPIEKYSAFRLDGLLFYVRFDFALQDRDELIIYDWKTGNKSNDELRQLTCYCMYASQKWDTPIENIKAVSVHLQPTLEAEIQQVDESSIEDLQMYARQSYTGMIKRLRDPQKDIAARDDFPMTGNFIRCKRCSFIGLCEQGKMQNAHPDEDIYDEYSEG